MGLAAQKKTEQDAKADTLGQPGGQRRPRDAEAEPKDEERVEQHVEHPAQGQPHHRKGGLALGPQKVIHHKAGGHHRRGQQDVEGVIPRKGQDGGGGPEQVHEGIHPQPPQHREAEAEGDGGVKGGGGIAAGGVGVLRAEAAADQAARPHAEGEAHRLDHRHDAEDDAHCPRGAGAQLADKIGVGHVVDGGDQHADHGGRGEGEHQPRDGGGGHLLILILLAAQGVSRSFFFGSVIFFTILSISANRPAHKGKSLSCGLHCS